MNLTERSAAGSVLESLADLRAQVERLTERQVAACRRAGMSWTEIGDTLGVSHVTASTRWKDVMEISTTTNWSLAEGETIRRKDLQDQFGGNRQRGIVTTPNNIFLFSEGGEDHGYDDFAESDVIYVYTGEGKTGDQTMARGNAAILDHAATSRPLRLFAGARGVVTYLGEYRYDEHVWAPAPDSTGVGVRQVIKFRLRKV
jgi:hypothetical protein